MEFFQWRHFGAEYEGPNADYTGKGVDQLTDLIHRIKTQPDSRRLILCAWNAKGKRVSFFLFVF